nr:zinc finger, CCHC-type [Tanacetum cinerariifolium]
MKALLEQQGLAAALDELPTTTIVAYDNVIQKKVFSALILYLGDQVLWKITKERTAAGIWKKLMTLYMTKSLANRLYLKRKLYTFHMHRGDGGKGLYVRGRSGQRDMEQGTDSAWSKSQEKSSKLRTIGLDHEFKELIPYNIHERYLVDLKSMIVRSIQQCTKSGVAKHLGVAVIQQQNGLVKETNVTLLAKKARLKDDMDAQSDVYMLNNSCKKCSDESDGYYWEDQSGNTLRVSQSRFYNEKLVQTLLERHSILSLKGGLSGDCDVEKNGFVDFDYAMGRLITVIAGYDTYRGCKRGYLAKGTRNRDRIRAKIVAGITTGALSKAIPGPWVCEIFIHERIVHTPLELSVCELIVLTPLKLIVHNALEFIVHELIVVTPLELIALKPLELTVRELIVLTPLKLIVHKISYTIRTYCSWHFTISLCS